MHTPLRVGIVGLSASGGWAAAAHVPALQHLPDFELVAGTASSPESTRAAVENFGLPHSFGSPAEMAESDEVDVFVVTIKVPLHEAALGPALRAGKIVVCEWPLASDSTQARELASAASSPTFVGLQARSAPSIRYLTDLIADGYVGEVLSTTVVGSGGTWGAEVDPRNAYTLDNRTGATMLTIPFGHAIDAVCMALGEFTSVTATLATRRATVLESGTGRTLPMTAPDQVAVTGVLDSGAVVAAHYRGGVSAATNFRWEINGTHGDLVITADSGHVQMSELTIHGSQRGAQLEVLPIPARYDLVDREFARNSPRAYNVASAYAQIAADLRDGTTVTPTFEHAVMRHAFLDLAARSTDSAVHIPR
ncbi:Gfo/Idh/MocA family oxidoreductase [Mycolicibacterium neoaurum]|uniref:Gfo/Idh/MocA family protein n=1 Tax=Mycolicibacterium neoaurum TaxID=1795 RepID=UPI00267242C2|nr:Gfo/Idh/MocA family oxidoreductase [Mycolicibacterium neoaurum]MDO3402772.1 Gfo/Idh/MocA family oxidoreductase [Mycolicibacterium neoaurum]